MRAISIEFNGYQRLAKAKCNTDGKMIAFLGPNEAGKTTVMRALEWFSNGTEGLSERATNKIDRPDRFTRVVSVTYWLEKADLEALATLRLATLPTKYRAHKTKSGGRVAWVDVEWARDPKPFVLVARLLDGVEAEFEEEFAADAAAVTEEAAGTISVWIRTVRALATDPGVDGWDANFNGEVDGLLRWLRHPAPVAESEEQGDRPRSDRAADAIEEVRRLLRFGELDDAAFEILGKRIPEFALFSGEDRDLRSAYDLNDEGLRNSPPAALANLAWVADLDLGALWEANANGDVRAARTMERRANEQLRDKLGPRWSQKDLDVQFNVDGSNLEVLIYENDKDGANTPIEERSDGLRLFVSLVAFLARHDFDQPPILLVDEAETHLHYDAQADLIEVLTNDVQATQVFYTTHSPGCLPRDLGTGIRLVAPAPGRSDASVLRNDFWTSNEPGFTPLLFAMGAGAAAFSAFRRAVMTEGASDMILLPSLLRLATGKRELDFQVAPGLANYSGTGLELEETAARVVYLLDGDQGGDDKKAHLIDDLAVDPSRVLQFPAATALEDYVHPDLYLSLINALLKPQDPADALTHDALATDVPIGKAVELWCNDRGLEPPGKPLVATQLANEPYDFVEEGKPTELKLAEGADGVLKTLHAEISKALGVRATPRKR